MFIKTAKYMAKYKKALKIKESKLLWHYIFYSAGNVSRRIKTIKKFLTLQEFMRHSLIFEVENDINHEIILTFLSPKKGHKMKYH